MELCLDRSISVSGVAHALRPSAMSDGVEAATPVLASSPGPEGLRRQLPANLSSLQLLRHQGR